MISAGTTSENGTAGFIHAMSVGLLQTGWIGMNENRLVDILLRGRGRYVVWMETSDQWDIRSMVDIDNLGLLQLSTSPKDRHWGDDWDDNPASGNAGRPYNDHGDITDLVINKDTKIFIEDDVIDIVSEAIEILRDFYRS